MQSNNKKKICIVVSSLGKGGAERSASTLSKMLSDLGHTIHIVSVLNKVDYSYAGTLFNLGILKDKDDSLSGRYKRFKAFKNYLETHRFDCIIDSRSRPSGLKEWIISRWLYANQKVIYIVHSFRMRTYFPKQKWLANSIYSKAYKLVAVSKEIKERIKNDYKINQVETIYNAIDVNAISKLSEEQVGIDEKYILFYGRLVDAIKNVSLLIEAYRLSKLSKEGVKLIILGDGKDKDVLVQKVEHLALSDYIQFEPFTNNPFPFIKNALFTVLTSRYEGFPMVLPESLALGIPVVSVNCSSGPKEIIIPFKNGLLVENNNPEALAEAMYNFIFDEHLYNQCKNFAEESVRPFSFEVISEAWNKLLE